MGGAFEDQELLRLRGALVLLLDVREPEDVLAADVAAGDDEELPARQALGLVDRGVGEEDQPVDLPRPGVDRGLPGGPAAEAAADDRDRLGALRPGEADRGEDVQGISRVGFIINLISEVPLTSL